MSGFSGVTTTFSDHEGPNNAYAGEWNSLSERSELMSLHSWTSRRPCRVGFYQGDGELWRDDRTEQKCPQCRLGVRLATALCRTVTSLSPFTITGTPEVGLATILELTDYGLSFYLVTGATASSWAEALRDTCE